MIDGWAMPMRWFTAWFSSPKEVWMDVNGEYEMTCWRTQARNTSKGEKPAKDGRQRKINAEQKGPCRIYNGQIACA